MTGTVDRYSGAFFFVFGLALYFYVIPNYVEVVDGADFAPSFMPNVYALGMAAGGLILVSKPTDHQAPDTRLLLRTGLFVILLFAALYAISWVGYVVVAPILALTLMVLIGERRPLWLLVGVAIIPATIWVFVTQLLDRSLP